MGNYQITKNNNMSFSHLHSNYDPNLPPDLQGWQFDEGHKCIMCTDDCDFNRDEDDYPICDSCKRKDDPDHYYEITRERER